MQREPSIVSVETTIEHGQFRWLGHVMRRKGNKLIKQIYVPHKRNGKRKLGEQAHKAGEKKG